MHVVKKSDPTFVKKPYDLSLLEGLNDPVCLQEIVGLFLIHTPLMIDELLADAGKEDWKKVYECAHKLKGSTGLLLAAELMELLKQIEAQAISHKNTNIMNGLLQSLVSAFSKLEISLKEDLQRIKDSGIG